MAGEKQRKKKPIQIQKPRFWPWEDRTDTWISISYQKDKLRPCSDEKQQNGSGEEEKEASA